MFSNVFFWTQKYWGAKNFWTRAKNGDETICRVLKEWLRVTAVGAIIAFTHKVTLFFLKRIEFFVCGVYDIYYSLNITKFNHSRLWCWTLGRKNKRNWKIKGSGSLFTGLTDEESIFITLKSSDIVQWTYNWCQVTPSVLLALWTPQPFGGASFCVLLRKTLTILFSQLIISLIWLWCLCGQVYYQIWWPF